MELNCKNPKDSLLKSSINFAKSPQGGTQMKKQFLIFSAYQFFKRPAIASLVGTVLNLILSTTAQAVPLPKSLETLILEHDITSVYAALELVQSTEAKSILKREELAEAIVSLNHLKHSSFHSLPFREEGYEEAFIQILKLDITQIASKEHIRKVTPTAHQASSQLAKEELLKDIQRSSISCSQCFPIQELPTELQPKALSILKYLFENEYLYTLIGGLKPMSSDPLTLSQLKISHEEFEKILPKLHCGDLQLSSLPNDQANSVNITLARLDRIQHVKTNYHDWLEDAHIPESSTLEHIMEAIHFPHTYDVSQLLLDGLFNTDMNFGNSVLKNNLSFLKTQLLNLNDQATSDDLLMGVLSHPHSNNLLIEVLKADADASKKCMSNILESLPGLRALYPELTQATPIEEFIHAIESHNKISEVKTEAIRTHAYKIFGALVGYPKHSIEYFITNPKTEESHAISFPQGFAYIVPKGHTPTEEDLKISQAAFNIYSYTTQHQVVSPSVNHSTQDELDYYRDFYRTQGEKNRCSPANLDHLQTNK
jgi:hypothetical protein